MRSFELLLMRRAVLYLFHHLLVKNSFSRAAFQDARIGVIGADDARPQGDLYEKFA